jgi:hypothetical protein
MADGGDYRHAWEGCRDWFNDDKILNLCSIAHGSLIRNNFHNATQRDCFLCTLDAGAAFLSGKSPMPIDDAKKGTLLHIGRLSKSEEKIYDLMEKAEDLWLEKERLESIAIADGAPDANAAKLAADEASSAALLAMGKAMEAQTAKELADNERDERARMTSVERAAKVVERDHERDRKRAKKEAEDEAKRVAKAERDCKRAEKVAEESVERADKVVERDRKRAKKEAEDEAKRVASAERDRKRAEKVAEEEAQRVAKPPGSITWTVEVDASIESMLDGGDSFSKMDIKNRW